MEERIFFAPRLADAIAGSYVYACVWTANVDNVAMACLYALAAGGVSSMPDD